MSAVPPRCITLPRDRDAWRSARNARRIVLEKVRARRRLLIYRGSRPISYPERKANI